MARETEAAKTARRMVQWWTYLQQALFMGEAVHPYSGLLPDGEMVATVANAPDAAAGPGTAGPRHAADATGNAAVCRPGLC